MLVANCSREEETRSQAADVMRQVAKEAGVSLTLSDFVSASELATEVGEKNIAPDIVLVDADDPDAIGIAGGLKLRRAGYRGVLIVVSKTDDYALPAFDVGAFNYALKGDADDEQRFRRIFTRALAQVLRSHRKYLMLNGISTHHNVPIDTISYFEVQGRICTAHFSNGSRFDFIATLDELEVKLLAYGFVRTHRSYMVNLSHVVKCKAKLAILDDGTEVPIGRSKHDQVFQMYEKVAGGRKPDAVEIRDSYLTS